jgi:hypothetical protein
MIFRLVMLFVAAYLGAVVFYSRREAAPYRLFALGLVRAAVVAAWTIGAFLFMTLVEWIFIDS